MEAILRCFEQHFLEIKITWFLKNVPQKTRKLALVAVSGCDACELVEMQWTLLQILETLNWTLICLIRARGVSVKGEGPKLYCYSNILQPPSSVLYPAVFWGCRFFDKRSEEKNRCAAGWSGGRCKPSPVGSRDKALESFGYFAF